MAHNEERHILSQKPRRADAPRPLLPDIGWGLGWALAMATAFSAWVLLLAALRGSARFDKYEMTAGQIVRAYYGTALVAGTLLGICRPFTRTQAGTMGVGALVGTAIYAGIGVSMYGVHTSTFVMGAVLGVPMGALLGRKHWKEAHPDTPAT